MAMYRPGAATALVSGAIADGGSTFDILARQVVADIQTRVRDVSGDPLANTVLATNGLIGGTLLVVGWADSGSAILIEALGEAASEGISVTVMPFAASAERITVTGTPERVRVAYEKTDAGVAVSIQVKVSNVEHP